MSTFPGSGPRMEILYAALKGILEGITEFLPISSTGHLILARDFWSVGDEKIEALFDIVIQFPAILAIVVLYRQRLWESVRGLGKDAHAWRFWFGLFVAFLPAAILGVLFLDRIEEKLFAPVPVAVALILGGAILILVDREPKRPAPADEGKEEDVSPVETPRIARAEETPLRVALQIGIFQCLALIPGTSRSGATIVGARLLGLTREASAEYSFFLALPTMFGAFVYKFAKSWHLIDWSHDLPILAVGSVASFLSAWIVVRWFIRFLQKHSLAAFGWYRIVLGALVIWYAAG